MRHADILQLHYQYAFARLNPGKAVVLPPNGFASRSLPAPASAQIPDIAPGARPAARTNDPVWPYTSARPTPNAAYLEQGNVRAAAPFVVEMASTMRPGKRAGRVVERVDAEGVDLAAPPRDTYQRTYPDAAYGAASSAQDAVSVELQDVSPSASTSERLAAIAQPSQDAGRPWRLRPERQSLLVAGALALGICGTSLYFSHPDLHAVAMAWSTYRAAAAHPDRTNNAGSTSRTNVAAAKAVPASGLAFPVQTGNATRPVEANAPHPVNSSGISIPMVSGELPHGLTSNDLMENGQKGSPLSNVSPESLRARAPDPEAQGVSEVTAPAAPVNVYNAPIRKLLPVIHHSVQAASQPAPVRHRTVRPSDEVSQNGSAHASVSPVATPEVTNVPAQTAEPARSQDANEADQKLF